MTTQIHPHPTPIEEVSGEGPSGPTNRHPARAEEAHDGVAVGLVIVVAAVFGVMAAFGEIYADTFPFLAFFLVAAWITARRDTRKLRTAVAVLMTVFVSINLVYAVPDLAHPESFGPFVPTLVVVVGGALTVVLAAASAARRPLDGRRIWTVTGVGLALAAVVSFAAAAAVEDDVIQPGDVEVVAADVRFPERIVMDAGSSALFVENHDGFRHTIVIDDHLSPVELPADTDVRVPLDLEPGVYEYFCDVAGHDSMRGILEVRG